PFDHAKPAWYYVADILLGILPWSLLLPSFLVYLCRRRSPGHVGRPQGLGLFVLSAGWCLLFYSLAGSQRPGYILPAMVPLALALGCYVNAIVQAILASPTFEVLERACSWASRLGIAILLAGLWFGVLGLLAGYLRIGPALLVIAVAVVSCVCITRCARNRD